MPTTACLYFHECPSCGVLMKPKLGDCCVFCSYGDVPCPPIQADRSCGEADCGEGAQQAVEPEDSSRSVLNPAVLTTSDARAAFDAVMRQGFNGKFRDPLPRAEAAMLSHILTFFADAGRSPSSAELAASSGLEITEAARSIGSLAARDFVVIDETGQLTGAYPFTNRPTPHRVAFAGTAATVHAMCAIDALGAGSIVDQDIEITSSCASCHGPIIAMTFDKGRKLGAISPPQTLVKVGATDPCSCAADTLCPAIEFICCSGEACVPGAGLLLSAADALEVGRALFENRARR